MKKINFAMTFAILFAVLVYPVFKANSTAITYLPSASSVGAIDLFSQKGGQGINQSDGVFQPEEQVILYAFVTYDQNPVVNKLVSFEVHGPTNPYNNITLVLTVPTNASGIVETSFTIPWPSENPEAIILGTWNAFAIAEIAEQIVIDMLTFAVRMRGDINIDGKVDGKDVAIVAKAFGSYPQHPRWNYVADENEDNVIDGKDIAIVAKYFGKKYV